MTLDVRNLPTVTDYLILVTGTSAPQLKALSESVELRLKKLGEKVYRMSGTAESEWLVLDYVNVVVHIFSEEARAFYDLQTLWKDGTPVDIPGAAV